MALTSCLFCHRNSAKGTVIKRPHLSDQQHFLEFEVQEQDPGLEGNSKYAQNTKYIHIHIILVQSITRIRQVLLDPGHSLGHRQHSDWYKKQRIKRYIIISLIFIIPLIFITRIILVILIILQVRVQFWITSCGKSAEISSNLKCVLGGWRTSARPILMGR